MSSTTDKLRGLVEVLYARTDQNTIAWQISEDKETVWSVIGDHKIELNEEQRDRFEVDIRVTVFDKNGNQIDTFADNYFGGLSPKSGNFSSYFNLMSTLLEMAKRQASGADAAIVNILKALGGKPISNIRPETIEGYADDLDDDVPF